MIQFVSHLLCNSSRIYLGKLVEEVLGDGYQLLLTGNSPFDTTAGVYLKCVHHNELMKINLFDAISDCVTPAQLQEAASKCAQCAAVLPPTRWPEGAEL